MTIYYFDNSSPSASDKNSGTSAASPFASLSALRKIALRPGDTVAIKAGTTYNVNAGGAAALSLTASGTAANPITITSYGTGNKPIINNASTQMYSDGLGLKNSHYVTVNGISFNSASQAAVNIDTKSSHITVKDSEMTNVGEGVLLWGSNSNIDNNYMHDLHMIKNTPMNKTSATTISKTRDDDYGANGVCVAGSNNEFSFNKIIKAIAPSYDYGVDGGGFSLFGGVSNLSIHDNYVAGSAGFLEAGSGGHNAISNIDISNNVSYDSGNFVVMHNRGGNFSSTYSNVTANHNTIVDDDNSSKEMANVFYDGPATASQIAFRDNIVSLNAGDSVFKQEGSYHSDNFIYIPSKATHLYNDWNNTLGAGEVYGNPGLTQAASGNFTSTVSGVAQRFGAAIGGKLQDVISGLTIVSKTAVSTLAPGTDGPPSSPDPGPTIPPATSPTNPSTTAPVDPPVTPPPTGPMTPPTSPSTLPDDATVGSGVDKLVLQVSESAYQGDAQYTVSVDGQQVGGILTAHSSHAAGADDSLTVEGDWAEGSHSVSVRFLNDLYAGTASADRNLFVDGATIDGAAVDNSHLNLMSSGTRSFDFVTASTSLSPTGPPASPDDATVGSGVDKLVLQVSESAYQGDAQYTVSVDGQQVGDVLTAHSSHATGADDTLTVEGNWAEGSHSVSVHFLNDLYAGTTSADRNLFVDGATIDGADVDNSHLNLMSSGAGAFNFSKH